MAVAGKQMLDMMKARGGNEQDYAEEVYGTVQSTSPLKIWVTSKLILEGDFIELSMLARELKIHVALPVTGSANVGGSSATGGAVAASGSITGTAEGDVVVWRGLQAGDKVRMLRLQKGQRYLVLERA